MDPSIQTFLDNYKHYNERHKFEGMRFWVFYNMPVNALRAMGVTEKFICDHNELVGKKQNKLNATSRRSLQDSEMSRLQNNEQRLQQNNVTTCSRSPDFAYRTPTVPIDMVLDTCQPKLGENCCLNFQKNG